MSLTISDRELVKIRSGDNWASEMAVVFPPSVVLWRTIEAHAVKGAFVRHCATHPIMDLGCGEGQFARVVFEKGELDVGLEIEEPLIHAASSTGAYGCTVLGDGKHFPFDDASFATVFSNSVIEHIDALDKVLSEVFRVLEPQGLFIATVPSVTLKDGLYYRRLLGAFGLTSLANAYGAAVNKKLHHVNLHDTEGWRVRLESSGLKLIEATPYLGVRAVEAWDKLSVEYFLRRCLGLRMPSRSGIVRARIDQDGAQPYGALVLVAQKPGTLA